MSTEPVSLDLDRRSFMKASALAGALTIGGGVTGRVLAQEGEDDGTDGTDDDSELSKTICNFCAVGCGFRGERKGNAFVGQEPWFDNPINNGSVCSKGAAIYGSEHSPKRLKHPLKKVDGEWKKIGWGDALDEVANELDRIRNEHSPDSVMWLGSAHFCNEEAYAFRKLSCFFGTNNCDHQARICHSTTVAGLANTWGYGAMTNPINDYRNYDLLLIIGQNPAESHPVSMQHVLEGQKRGGKIINVDPRFTKTSAHADEFYRMRPGTDVAMMFGLIRYMKDQGELNREFIENRVQGWPDVEAELEKYDLETVSDITWVSVEDIKRIGDAMIENKPNIHIEWAMGGTQHNNGTQNIRSYALAGLATGGIARPGGGMQVMRGHANVQGATDLAVSSTLLPGYYSIGAPASWQYWADVWTKSPFTTGSVTFRELYDGFDMLPKELYARQANPEDADAKKEKASTKERFPDKRSMIFQNGLSVARWYEAALPKEDRLLETPIYQSEPVKAAIFWGHSANSITEMDRMKAAMDNLDLLVVVDLFPSVASVLPDREDGIIILPAASQYEHYRSVTNSHRAVQWSEPVRPPSHNTKPDLEIMQELASRLGYRDHFNWGAGNSLYDRRTTYANVLREINLGVRIIGYQQDPDRLERQHDYDSTFSTEDTKCHQAGLPVSGEYWQLPWPCWGEGHPGTPILWRDSLDPRDGGQDFRPRWGDTAPTPEEWGKTYETTEEYPFQKTIEKEGREGLNMLRNPYKPDWYDGGEIKGVPQYPGFSTVLPDDPSNADALTLPLEYALRPDKSVYDCAKELNKRPEYNFPLDFFEQYDYKQPDPPTGRGRARGVAWNFLDRVPIHREPIESPRPDLVEKWPANGRQFNFFRLDADNALLQKRAMKLVQEQGLDTIMTTGRQVEHQGGGAESRSNIFLADLQPHMYAEIHPDMAEEKNIEGGELVVVSTTNRGSVLVKARVTYRPAPNEVFLPFHWGGIFQGKSLEEKYPEGTVPFAIGDSVNAITSQGYDVETQMQETKVAMVRVRKATPQLLEDLNMDADLTFPQDRNGVGMQKEYDVRDFNVIQ